MIRSLRPLLLLSALAVGMTGSAGSVGAAERETLAAVIPAPATRAAAEMAAPAVVVPAALSRPVAVRRAPTLNHQRPLNDDLERFTRAF